MVNKIFNESNLDTMKKILDDSISGIITSPPYNITTKRKDMYYDNGYSESDNLSEEDYISIRLKEFNEFSRIVRPGGVICYNMSYHHLNPILPLKLITIVHNDTNLTLVDIISWKKPHSIPFQTSPTKLSRIVENIYILTHKDNINNFITNKQISSINKRTGQKFYKNYINYIEAKNNDGFKSKLKSSFSTELVLKLIDIYFPKDSIIYDPFSGIGTTPKGCILSNRKYIGSELDKEIFEDSIKNIKGED